MVCAPRPIGKRPFYPLQVSPKRFGRGKHKDHFRYKTAKSEGEQVWARVARVSTALPVQRVTRVEEICWTVIHASGVARPAFQVREWLKWNHSHSRTDFTDSSGFDDVVM